MDISIFAAEDIADRDEILNCYGPNHKLMKRSDRLKALEDQYCFQCTCVYCAQLYSRDDVC